MQRRMRECGKVLWLQRRLQVLGGWCGWSGICKAYNRAGKFQWLLVPVQGRRDWWYELFLNQISNSLFLRSASTRINISRVLCFSKFSIVETKFGGPSLVIHHNIVPVFKFSDNVSLQTKWSKWLYLLVMWAGMILFYLLVLVIGVIAS